MNTLSLVLKPRPSPPWSAAPLLMSPTYFDIVIDGLSLWEHLAAAGKSNGFVYTEGGGGAGFYFRPERDEDEVGYFNYIPLSGWTPPSRQREWVSWLKCEASSDRLDDRVPLLVCGVCSGCAESTVQVERVDGEVRWFGFQEFGDGTKEGRLPELYAGLEFRFEGAAYDGAFEELLASLGSE